MSDIPLLNINDELLGRPSGLRPYRSRSRKAWVAFITDDIYDKLKDLKKPAKLEKYRELDKKVMSTFVSLCRLGIEGDEAMIEAGRRVASQVTL